MMSESEEQKAVPVIPGIKYGIFLQPDGQPQLIPNCRSVDTLWTYGELVAMGTVQLKLWENITDEDMCQRGPDGRPLPKVTPFVYFETKAEWADRMQRLVSKVESVDESAKTE